MNLFKKIYNIGVFEGQEKEHKKIRLLNIFCFTWFFFLLLYIITNPVASEFKSNLIIHLCSMLAILFVFILHYSKKYLAARILFLSAIISATFVFANIVATAEMMEIFYFIYPLVALVLIDKRVISLLFMIVCYLLYNYTFIVGSIVYESKIINPVLSLTVFIGGYVILNYSQSLNKKNEVVLESNREKLEVAYHKLEKAKEYEVAHLQLKSLKAQMNPHFMFNAMNSIQSLVLKGDKHEAYSYLTKFASLIRENLNMSEKSFVGFDEELSLLKKYLELEALRFRDNFEYEILGEEKIGDIKIPSMIIQPYIENAIKHGLLHKREGVKKIKIAFYLEDVFKCVITDNGIGIKASEEINKANQHKEVSFSTKAIQDRLVLLKNYYQADIGVTYEEVTEGTKVIVKIPYSI